MNPQTRLSCTILAPGYISRRQRQASKASLKGHRSLEWEEPPEQSGGNSRPCSAGIACAPFRRGPRSTSTSPRRLGPWVIISRGPQRLPGFLPAHFVTHVAAGYVNSGQRVYGGRGHSLLLARGGISPSNWHRLQGSLGGAEVPLASVSGRILCGLWMAG
jgi:hypothetical protein